MEKDDLYERPQKKVQWINLTKFIRESSMVMSTFQDNVQKNSKSQICNQMLFIYKKFNKEL